MTRYSPGAVVIVHFPFTRLHSSKKRPAVVISPTGYDLRYGDVVVMGLTSRPQPEPFLSLQRWKMAGLLGPTWIKPTVFTLADSLIERQIGNLDDADVFRISQALALLLDNQYLR